MASLLLPLSSVPSTLLRANEIMLSDDESEIEDEMDTQSEQDFSNEPSAGEWSTDFQFPSLGSGIECFLVSHFVLVEFRFSRLSTIAEWRFA